MKKLVFIALLFVGAFAFGQSPGVGSYTTAQIDGATVPAGKQRIFYDSDLGQFGYKNGSDVWFWLITEEDINTFAELQAIVADEVIIKSGDNISVFTNDSGYLTSLNGITSANITDGTIDILDLDSGVQTSLGLADTALQAETNDLSSAVTWANVPDANITESSVTQHESALTITESQVSDLGSYLENISEDASPSLSANLDGNGNAIQNVSGVSGEAIFLTNRIQLDAETAASVVSGLGSLYNDDVLNRLRFDDGTGFKTINLDGDPVDEDVSDATFDASGFSGNLTTSDNTVQELADAVDGLSTGGGGGNPTDELNTGISFDGVNLTVTDAGGNQTVDISSVSTDDQTLSFDGTNLSIEDGNSVDISGVSTDDQTAAEVDITDSGGYYTGIDVEAALQELGHGVTLADITVVGDGSTDKTSEVNAALAAYDIAYIVGGVVTTSTIELGDGEQLIGPGTITNNTTDVIELNGRNMHIDVQGISSNAGHIITFAGNTFHATIKNTRLSALNTGKSQIYHRGAVGVYQLTVEDCELETGPNHTVPQVDVIASAENFNDNKFVNNLYQTNGSPTAPVIRLETTAAALWMSGNIIDGALFEIPTAGAVHAFSQAGLKLNNIHVYDLPTSGAATDDMILIDNGSGPGLNSAGVQISGYHRIAGDLTTNTVYDINNQGAYAGSITVIDAVGLASSQLLFNNLSGHKVLGGYYISNYGGAVPIEAGADVTDEANVTAALDGATLTDIGTPASGDKILIQDASDSDNLKYAEFSEFGGGGGSGDVVGPASSVNNELAIFDGTTGKLLKNDSRFYVDGTTGELVVADPSGSVRLDRNAFALEGTDGDEDFFFANRTAGDIFMRTTNASSSVQTRLTIPGGTNNPVIDAAADFNISGGNDLSIAGTFLSSTGGADLVGYDNTASGLTATTVQDAIDENAATDAAQDTEIGGLGTRVTDIEDALETVPASQYGFDLKTANYTLVANDALDSLMLYAQFDDEEITLPSGVFSSGQSIRILRDSASITAPRIVEGSGINIVGFGDAPGDGIELGAYPSGVTLSRTSSGTGPETWQVTDYFGTISEYTAASLGSELLTNGDDFSSGWSYQNGSSATGGVATAIGNGTLTASAANHVVYQDITALTNGTTYQIEITWRRVSGSGDAYVGIKFTNQQTESGLSGTFVTDTYQFTAGASGQDRLAIGAASGTTLEIDSVSLKEVL